MLLQLIVVGMVVGIMMVVMVVVVMVVVVVVMVVVVSSIIDELVLHKLHKVRLALSALRDALLVTLQRAPHVHPEKRRKHGKDAGGDACDS